MDFTVRITGLSPLIVHNGAKGLDTKSAAKLEIAEITRKRGSNRTDTDDARLLELECQNSLYLDESGAPTFPTAGFRTCIETAARKLKQGPMVREGLVVTGLTFDYDRSLGKTVEELGQTLQFTVPVVVQRARLLRTRAKFDEWSMVVTIDTDEELVDRQQLQTWLDIGGTRIGLGDWRPEKSGSNGRFTATID